MVNTFGLTGQAGIGPPPAPRLLETPNFMLVTTADIPRAEKLGGFMERTLRAILNNLEGAASDDPGGEF